LFTPSPVVAFDPDHGKAVLLINFIGVRMDIKRVQTSCFDISRKLLLKVERVVAETDRREVPEKTGAVMHRFLFGPIAFLLMGLRVIFTPLAVWGVLTIIMWPILLVIGQNQSGVSNVAFGIAAFLAGGFVTYMLPSGCAVVGIKANHVTAATQAVIEASSCKDALRRLREAIDLMKARCESRIKRLSWGLGIAWAALLWAFMNTVLKPDLAAAERNQNANDLLGYALVFLLAAVGFACYEAAVKVLFQTIDFAFIEASAEFDEAAQ
jgi:hypothetical protein